MATNPTTNFDFQNFYSATLTADITSGSTTINLDTVPVPTEGILIIDPNSATNREVIFYTGKGASTITLPADGRGWDGSTATAHLNGTTVIMAPTAYMMRMMKNGSLFDATKTGWTTLGYTFGTVVANGNRSYTCTVAGQDVTSTVSPGMRIKTTRTVAAPTQCTSLNGTTQYYSKAAPAGMAQTDNITVMAWVKPTVYQNSGIASRQNGSTDGWFCYINNTGQIVIGGARAADDSALSYQSVPLNKWSHVAATMNSAGAVSTMYIDGVSVPVTFTNNGNSGFAAPTQSLLIGALNGASPSSFFAGKIAQVAVFSAVLSQATIQSYISQGLAGTETSIISAYSFNNSINDLNANANNLTANGSAVATNADSPFGGQAGGTISSTLDYGIIQSATFSTNTTLVVQVPEGCTIPTSGGVSAVSYSSTAAPYGFPKQKDKWRVSMFNRNNPLQASPVSGTWYNLGSCQLNVPIGEWELSYQVNQQIVGASMTGNQDNQSYVTLSTANNSETDSEMSGYVENLINISANSGAIAALVNRTRGASLAAATPYYLNAKSTSSSLAASISFVGNNGVTKIIAENAYL